MGSPPKLHIVRDDERRILDTPIDGFWDLTGLKHIHPCEEGNPYCECNQQVDFCCADALTEEDND